MSKRFLLLSGLALGALLMLLIAADSPSKFATVAEANAAASNKVVVLAGTSTTVAKTATNGTVYYAVNASGGGGGGSVNYADFYGTNGVNTLTNPATGKIVIGPATPISTTASNAAINLSVHTNETWVAKNGSDSTGVPGNATRPFLTISNAVQAATSPATVNVAPGIYAESVILKSGVNINLAAGVVISQAVNLPVLFDNATVVTNCTVHGEGKLINSHASGGVAHGIHLTGDSDVTVKVVSIETLSHSGMGARIETGDPRLRLWADIYASYQGIDFNSDWGGEFHGQVFATNNYGVKTGNGSNYITGLVSAEHNSAIHFGGSFCYTLLENAYCISYDGDFGWALEHSGGQGEARNCVLVSRGEEAVGKYSGNLLVLDHVKMQAGTNATYCLDNDGGVNHGTIQIRGPCWGDKPVNPALNIVLGGVLVSNVFYSKQPFTISAATRTNFVANTNGSVTFPNSVTVSGPGTNLVVRDTNGTTFTSLYTQGGTLYSSASPPNQTVAVEEWAVMSGRTIVSGIDGKSIGNTTLVTVPTGRQLLVQQIILIPTAVDTLAVAATASVGKTAATYVDVVAATALTGLATVNSSMILSPIVNANVLQSGEALVLRVSTGATATTFTLKAIVVGLLL